MNDKSLTQKLSIKIGIALILLCLYLPSFAYAEDIKEPKNILVINSYHQGFTWSKDVTDGILDTFKRSGDNPSIFVEYMDWKNYPTDENVRYLNDYFKYKYQNKHIDELITSDDEALKFVLKNRESIFSNAPVVFCGVNQNGVTQITGGYKNFTGVLEEIDPTDTVKMALGINPGLKNVYILFDNSESGLSAGEIVVSKIKAMGMNLNFGAYKTLVLGVSAAFIILISFVCILMFYIAQIKRIKENLFKSEERFRIATDGSNAIIWDADMLNMHYNFSDRWYELLGYEKNEVNEVNGGWKTIIHPDDVMGADKARNSHLEGKTPFYNCEYRMRMKNGNYKWFNVRGKVLKDNNGKNIRFAGSLIDITEKKEYEAKLQESYQELESTYEELTAAQEELMQQYGEILTNHEKIKVTEERLAHLAYHDTLTGLPNKLSLYENSQNNIFILQNGKSALLFIDVDHLKNINDTMGHAFGDQLIIKVSERLTSLLSDGCSIYRLSGDELIIIMQGIKGKEDAEEFASIILAGFKEEFIVLDSTLHISLSIGIAMYSEHGSDIEELLKYADIAMFRAKVTSRNTYVVYDQLMKEVFTERVNIEKHLHTALRNSEFEIHYQPQLDLTSNRITGLEALLRWKSPELGSVSPLKFIKIAEDIHLIIPLGAWVLRNACAFLQKLHKKGYADLSVSVNVSMLQLLQVDFSDMVLGILESFELKPEYLELEITESILMESFETIGLKLEELSERGVRIALDDFGKGYSSLNYLKQLPISTLKIDKLFIDNISYESDENILTGHIVTIGKSMGMCVIAEGVERQEQLEYLVRHGCDKIQGYYFSKPVPEAEVIKLLEI